MKAMYCIMVAGVEENGATTVVLPWYVKDTEWDICDEETPVIIENEAHLYRFVENWAEATDEGDIALIKMDETSITVLYQHRGYYKPDWED